MENSPYAGCNRNRAHEFAQRSLSMSVLVQTSVHGCMHAFVQEIRNAVGRIVPELVVLGGLSQFDQMDQDMGGS